MTEQMKAVLDAYVTAVRAANLNNDKRELLNMRFILELSNEGLIPNGSIFGAAKTICDRTCKT